MVIIRFILPLFFLISTAQASQITRAWKSKNYKQISEIYRKNRTKNFSRKEMIFISYSLRKMGYFRQDIKLNIRLIKKHYLKQHVKLLKAMKRGDTIDGDAYPNALKVLYWNIFTSYGQILKGYSQESKLVEKDHKNFQTFSKLLSELEFREGKVDKYNDNIIAHRQYLTDKIYRFKTSLFLQYMSWQQEATIRHVTDGEAGLVLTNKGFCLGGDVGYENYRFHFYVDGCFMYGSGGVKNNDVSVIENYQQSDVPAYGFKVGPGASLIVSSSKSRIGVKLPMIFSVQPLATPNSNYTIDEGPAFSVIGSVYSRWQFDKWYLQTEFGKYLQQEQTMWAFGLGREF